ncbi:14208_t:CDS:2 [Gigaspora rosea]|nr:14208_t:CDS:2 [Gigaspora rosea]
MNHENNYAKVLVDDESKHEIIKFKSKPEDTKKIKYDFLNGFWGDDKKYKKYYVKRIRFLTEKEIVYYGWTINDIEHEGGCFGGATKYLPAGTKCCGNTICCSAGEQCCNDGLNVVCCPLDNICCGNYCCGGFFSKCCIPAGPHQNCNNDFALEPVCVPF